MSIKWGEWMTRGAGRCLATAVVVLLCFAAHPLARAQETAQSIHADALAQRELMKCRPAVINRSLQQHVMPDVYRCTYDGVVNSFRIFGGGVPQRKERFFDAPVGQIVDQAPLAGQIVGKVPELKSKLLPDKPIVLTVSRGLYSQTLPAASPAPTSSAPKNPPAPATTTPAPVKGKKSIVAAPHVEVPYVVGWSESDAQNAIAQRQLRAISRGDEPSPKQRGEVTRTLPHANVQVSRGSDVSYWMASGSNFVPWLGDRTIDQAPALLATTGFRLGVVTYRSSPGTAGLIVEQDPQTNTIAPLGSPVAVTVNTQSVKSIGDPQKKKHGSPGSRGAGTVSPQPVIVEVPSVLNMSLEQAISKLDRAGLTSGKVVHEFHLSPAGYVSRQDPLPGAIVERPAVVSLWVASAQASIMTLAAGLFVGLAGIAGWLWHRHLIEVTRRLLHIKPSLASASEMHVALAMQMDGPTVALRARLEMGEVRFEGPVPIERRETSHD